MATMLSFARQVREIKGEEDVSNREPRSGLGHTTSTLGLGHIRIWRNLDLSIFFLDEEPFKDSSKKLNITNNRISPNLH